MKTSLIIYCVLILFLSADIVLGQNPIDYWCMKEGQKYVTDVATYNGARLVKKESIVYKVLNNIKVKEGIKQKVSLQFYSESKSGSKFNGEIVGYFEVLPSEIKYVAYQFPSEEVQKEEYPLIELKYPLKKGDSWNTVYQHFPINQELGQIIKLNLEVIVADTGLDITTHHGKFESCIKTIEKGKSDSTFLIHNNVGQVVLAYLNYQRTEWWAKNFGCIKAEVNEVYKKVNDSNEMVIEFKKYYEVR